MTPAGLLDRGLGELALDMPAVARDALLGYLGLLTKWNKTFNLTAVRDPLEMVRQHLLDSLAVLPHLPMGEGARLADVGSGAGLPGIPLAIARPQWQVTLNDSNSKKTAFLRQAAIELRIANLSVHEGRSEQWRPAALFAVVISRAFAELDTFIARCRHLVAPGGVLAAMRAGAPQAPEACDAIALKVPQSAARRHLVLCRVGA